MPVSRGILRLSYQGAVLLSVLAIAPLTWMWLAGSGHRVVAGSSPVFPGPRETSLEAALRPE
ncbi:hypothetical protein [Streptosporangium lutulentum]|uniref:Carbohydrate ABC transporter permease n=1 Tax=Streptosporangium lutulentum TaxID=1461250 RepID=A0ABT9QF27_9ACTN|nr:hypothetical protein [Streptosporangium lutulentum]MDP9844669.1 hypothetical protein [Streptosporangium lutulentum]